MLAKNEFVTTVFDLEKEIYIKHMASLTSSLIYIKQFCYSEIKVFISANVSFIINNKYIDFAVFFFQLKNMIF